MALCMLTAFIAFIPFIWQGEGVFLVRDDFNVQQIPFTIGLHNALLRQKGLDGWSWNYGLGASTIHAYSFYEMGSPFFWMTMLFPAAWFPYMVGWIYMLKYITAGMTSFFYLRRFVRNEVYAVTGALLYAFSGFQATNLLFYHFHDVVALFPLLLIGLDLMMEEEERREQIQQAPGMPGAKSRNVITSGRLCFVFAVFLNCLTNYFFFVHEVVFLILYFLTRYAVCGWKQLLRRILICILCGVWGAGMAAFLFIPSALYIFSNPRGSDSQIYLKNLVWDSRYFLHILKGFLLPGEPMHDQSSVLQGDYNSTACHLPFVGLVPALAYLFQRTDRYRWLSSLLIVLLICAFSPVLSAGFLLFNTIYQRWWFALVLMMALASVTVFDNADDYRRELKKSTIFCAAVLLLFFLLLRFVGWSEEEGLLLFHKDRFTALCIASLAGVCLTGFLLRKKDTRKIKTVHALLFCIVFCSVIFTALNLYLYRRESESAEDYMKTVRLYSQMEPIDEQYRYNSGDNVQTLSGEAAGLFGFSSTMSNSIWEFEHLFNHYRTSNHLNINSVPGLAQLLAGKYHVTKHSDEAHSVRSYDQDGIMQYVVADDACPIGFAMQYYITEEDLKALDLSKRGLMLMDAAVIAQADIPEVEGWLRKALPADFPEILGEDAVSAPESETEEGDIASDVANDETQINQYIQEKTAEAAASAVLDFDRDSDGFTCRTDYVNNTSVYFSVPYDPGWRAYIDEAEAQIIPSGGMMLLNVPAGDHSIRFAYHTRGYREGKWISIISCFAYIAVLIMAVKSRRHSLDSASAKKPA